MPIMGGGGGGAAFNGGTITQPLTVLETDGTSKGIVINTQGGFGVNALEIDAPDTTVTVDGDGDVAFSSAAGMAFDVFGTSGNAGVLSVYDDTPRFAHRLDSQLGLSVLYGAGNATLFSVTQSGGAALVVTAPPAPATATLSSGVGAQLATTHDVHSYTPVTFNPTAGAAATCAVAISKDGTNYTALWTETEPAGVALDGTIHGINVHVPTGWKLRLTVVNATIGTTTYY